MTSGDPSALSLGHLDKPDIRIVRLRLAYDVYAALERHLGALFTADVGDSGYGFVDVVREISKACLDSLVIVGEVQDTSAYHNQLANGFRAVEDRLEADPRHVNFVPIVNEIARALRPMTAAECAAGLEQINLRAWQYFQDLIDSWGGPHAADRKQVVLDMGPARLRVRVGDRDFTYCLYRSDEHEIRLLAGIGQPDLFTLLDLPFYFLHEYLSHVFPRWDDKRWRFSEAYLLFTAKQYLDERWKIQDRPQRPFLALNLAALRAQSDPQSTSDLKKAEDCCRELHELLQTRLFTHLLEWATIPASEADLEERGAVLSGLHRLVKDPATVEAAFQPGAVYETIQQRLLAWILNR